MPGKTVSGICPRRIKGTRRTVCTPATSRKGWFGHRAACDRDDADVVLLAEVLRRVRQFNGRTLRAEQFTYALEAEKVPINVRSLCDAVRNQHQPVIGLQMETHHRKLDI